MKALWWIFWMFVASVFFSAPTVTVAATDVTHKSESIEGKGAKTIVANISYGAGKLSIDPSGMTQPAKLDVMYTSDRRDYDLDYEVKQEVGYLTFKNRDQEIHEIDSKNNHLDVVLSTHYPTELKLEVGACDAAVDLGGIRLTQLSLEIGAASGDIDFSEPNPERMSDLKIEAGAASVGLTNLGNANFERLKFEGGAGKFDIDLRGKYTGESYVDLEIGLGKANIILPEEIPVRIKTNDNWFSSVDLHSRKLEKIDDGLYQSVGFDDAKIRLDIKLEVGMGSVDVRWR
jgi:hypothetical protein